MIKQGCISGVCQCLVKQLHALPQKDSTQGCTKAGFEPRVREDVTLSSEEPCIKNTNTTTTTTTTTTMTTKTATTAQTRMTTTTTTTTTATQKNEFALGAPRCSPNLLYKKIWPFPRSHQCTPELYLPEPTTGGSWQAEKICIICSSLACLSSSITCWYMTQQSLYSDEGMAEDHSGCTCEEIKCQFKFFGN